MDITEKNEGNKLEQNNIDFQRIIAIMQGYIIEKQMQKVSFKTEECLEKFIEYSSKIAIAIKSALEKRGITIQEFAEKMGVSIEKIEYWLSGKYNFDLKTIVEIEEKLGKVL